MSHFEEYQKIVKNQKEYFEKHGHHIIDKNDLQLCLCTSFDRDIITHADELEICKVHENGSAYTIATFNIIDESYKNIEENKKCLYLNVLEDRLDLNSINWKTFSELVEKGKYIIQHCNTTDKSTIITFPLKYQLFLKTFETNKD